MFLFYCKKNPVFLQLELSNLCDCMGSNYLTMFCKVQCTFCLNLLFINFFLFLFNSFRLAFAYPKQQCFLVIFMEIKLMLENFFKGRFIPSYFNFSCSFFKIKSLLNPSPIFSGLIICPYPLLKSSITDMFPTWKVFIFRFHLIFVVCLNVSNRYQMSSKLSFLKWVSIFSLWLLWSLPFF